MIICKDFVLFQHEKCRKEADGGKNIRGEDTWISRI